MIQFMRWFRTVRYLRPVQIYGRIWFKLYRPSIDLSPAADVRPITDVWAVPAQRKASLLHPWVFRFLNEEHALVGHTVWDDPTLSKLWRYNLHYFDDLNAEGAAARSVWHRMLIGRWVLENPPGQGTGWEPYPTSLRIVNWIKWTLAGNLLETEWRQSLAVQVRWLAKRLEVHLLGNHLFTNAKALIYAGLFFEGQEAADWLEKGMAILAREVPEQILPDGGHFERSPMYHALAMEDMLDLINLAGTYREAVPKHWHCFVASWPETVGGIRTWLAAMCHPDGEISFFNDASIGIAPSPECLAAYASRLGLQPVAATRDGVTHLVDSGYIRVQRVNMVALLDVAPVGPDYLPGHAHADTLSFELSVFGQRVLVNSGTSCYGLGPERSRQRETAAHNTVVVDGQSSSEVWAGFRVARRARPLGLEIVREGGVKVVCSHDGYRRLPGQPQHTRQWLFEAASLVVEDRVSGRFGHAEARFHLHPRVTLEALDGGVTGRIGLGNGRWLTWRVEMGELAIEESTYHPRFGISESSRCLVLHLRDGGSRIQFDWA